MTVDQLLHLLASMTPEQKRRAIGEIEAMAAEAPKVEPGVTPATTRGAEPRSKRHLDDIHADALDLAGLLHILNNYTPGPHDMAGRSAVVSLIDVASQLAFRVTDDLEAVL